jgi:processive 1,2-diacylglycerol beta-glucosyltransferase
MRRYENRMNILFLTAATGGGHVKAAQALMRQMEKQLPDCRTMLVDSLKYINPLVDKVVTGLYLQTIKKAPYIYGKFYDLSENDDFITDFVKAFNSLLSGRLNRLFKQYCFDAAVCAHTMPLQMLSSLKKKGLLNIPLLGIVTDFTHHSFWNLQGVDAFIVAHKAVKNEMIKLGIRDDRVFDCGIPVAEEFLKKDNRSIALKKLGLKNKPTLLLMGGSLGFGEMLSVFSSLLNLKRDIQIIAVAGHNSKLREGLEKLKKGTRKSVKVLGYTDKISELMDAADLLITKPGGITVSEALVKNLPIILTRPIPGQEERNARFLTEAGAAIKLHSCSALNEILKMTLDRPLTMRRMSEAAGKLARPNACFEIADLLEELLVNQPYPERLSVAAPIAAIQNLGASSPSILEQDATMLH